VLSKTLNTLSFVNTETMKTESAVPVGIQPHEMAITPDKTKAYVSNVGANTLSVIDLKNRKETKTISSADFLFPHGIVFTKDARRAFVTSEQKKKIVIIDAQKDVILRSIDTDQAGTHMVVLSPDGQWAYFTNRESNTVSVMDVNSTAIVANIPRRSRGGRDRAVAGRQPDLGGQSPRQFGNGDRRCETPGAGHAARRRGADSRRLQPGRKICFRPGGDVRRGLCLRRRFPAAAARH
jgi:YVTN family beta-propeller protein